MITNSVTKTSTASLTVGRALMPRQDPLRACASSASNTSGSVVFSPSRFSLPEPW